MSQRVSLLFYGGWWWGAQLNLPGKQPDVFHRIFEGRCSGRVCRLLLGTDMWLCIVESIGGEIVVAWGFMDGVKAVGKFHKG